MHFWGKGGVLYKKYNLKTANNLNAEEAVFHLKKTPQLFEKQRIIVPSSDRSGPNQEFFNEVSW